MKQIYFWVVAYTIIVPAKLFEIWWENTETWEKGRDILLIIGLIAVGYLVYEHIHIHLSFGANLK